MIPRRSTGLYQISPRPGETISPPRPSSSEPPKAPTPPGRSPFSYPCRSGPPHTMVLNAPSATAIGSPPAASFSHATGRRPTSGSRQTTITGAEGRNATIVASAAPARISLRSTSARSAIESASMAPECCHSAWPATVQVSVPKAYTPAQRSARRRVVSRVRTRNSTATESAAVTAAVSIAASIHALQSPSRAPASANRATAGSACTLGAAGVLLTSRPSSVRRACTGSSPDRAWMNGR